MPRPYQLIEAPSILGLWPSGVELLPYALQRSGLLPEAQPAQLVPALVTEFSGQRTSRREVLNTSQLAKYTRQLAAAVGAVRGAGQFPVVLGGDCSILLGCALALRREGTFGLAHVDAHADFYQPEAEPKGEAASMDLALVLGHGPAALTDLDHLQPYVHEHHAVQLGQRDAAEAEAAGSQRIEESGVLCLDLATIRRLGTEAAAARALARLTAPGLAGYWIHFDADVLADEIVPAVDYRIPDGLSWDEARTVLRSLVHTPGAAGLSVSIFNPKLDPDGTLTQQLTDFLNTALMRPA